MKKRIEQQKKRAPVIVVQHSTTSSSSKAGRMPSKSNAVGLDGKSGGEMKAISTTPGESNVSDVDVSDVAQSMSNAVQITGAIKAMKKPPAANKVHSTVTTTKVQQCVPEEAVRATAAAVLLKNASVLMTNTDKTTAQGTMTVLTTMANSRVIRANGSSTGPAERRPCPPQQPKNRRAINNEVQRDSSRQRSSEPTDKKSIHWKYV